MTDQTNARELKKISARIKKILEQRALGAQSSEYDRSVCIRAVGVARKTVQNVPVKGSAADYLEAVLSALGPVFETYNDPDGEYTSGRSSVGDVYSDIFRLRDG